MSKLSNIKELLFTKEGFKKSKFNHENDPFGQWWAKKGRPILWVETFNGKIEKDNIKVYKDIGYGHLKLVVNGKKEESWTGNEVVNGKYVLLSSYYGNKYEDKIFKRIN